MRGDLRNEFKFWNVHEIMNTSGLLQSVSQARRLCVNFARDSKYSDAMNRPKLNLLLIFFVIINTSI